jgi:hypothetical protein
MARQLVHIRIRTVLAVAVGAVLATAVMAAPSTAEVTAVDGSAFGAQASVTSLGSPITLAAVPTVSLPSSGGGPFSSTLASINVPGVLSTGALSVDTVGGNLNSHSGFATSNASVADVNVLAGLLSADVITSTCTSNGDGSTGSTTLANATVTGVGSLAATPAPNTTIDVANVGTITLNEQSRTDVVGSISTITVTGVHVHLAGVLASGDVYLARSVCEVTGPDVLTTPTPPTDPPSDPPTDGTPGGTPATPTTPPTPTTSVPTPTVAPPRFTG